MVILVCSEKLTETLKTVVPSFQGLLVSKGVAGLVAQQCQKAVTGCYNACFYTPQLASKYIGIVGCKERSQVPHIPSSYVLSYVIRKWLLYLKSVWNASRRLPFPFGSFPSGYTMNAAHYITRMSRPDTYPVHHLSAELSERLKDLLDQAGLGIIRPNSVSQFAQHAPELAIFRKAMALSNWKDDIEFLRNFRKIALLLAVSNTTTGKAPKTFPIYQLAPHLLHHPLYFSLPHPEGTTLSPSSLSFRKSHRPAFPYRRMTIIRFLFANVFVDFCST
ncbi:hypothetical protein DEU56DRAFT_755844 [Suillus clintonianus]|uniref:uncharacterized protein n=1 Tax=Suillus clintonianus TaxID=1904413 RepID=UPI001B86D558|nr:uncharacterized protein DEU56DRAFT_755844 [Suillus clintonianus]KAG2138555.1 hypothetical protein DEU56DRAFT_755844 [Suillus clintonianus]